MTAPVPELPEEHLLTTAEVAEICRTAPSTVRYWRYQGLGPPGFKAGKRVLYRQSDVTAWVIAQAEREHGS